MANATNEKPVLLLLDDMLDFRLVVEDYLNGDFQLVSFGDISGAVQYVFGNLPLDVVLTDFDLKSPDDSDGLDMARSVRLRYPRVPVILMSGHVKEEPRIQALLAMPFTYFIAKTSLCPELKELLASLFPELGAS